MNTPLEYPAVMIKWIDSYGCGSGWDEVPPQKAVPHYCYSMGWLVQDNNDVVVVIPHIGAKNEDAGLVEQGCGDMTIPKVAIIEMVRL